MSESTTMKKDNSSHKNDTSDPPSSPSSIPIMDASMFSSPVAVAVARKKKKKTFSTKQQQLLSAKKQPRSPTAKKTSPKNKKSTTPPPNKSLQAFFEGAALYGICIGLPALLGMIHRLYEQCSYQDETMTCVQYWFVVLSTSLWGLGGGNAANNEDPHTPKDNFDNYHDDEHDDLSLTAQDTNALPDVAVLCILSWTFAFLRIIFVQLLVPKYLVEPQRLEALVRCKSTSLLSASYTLTPKHSPNPLKQTLQTTTGKITTDTAMLLNTANHAEAMDDLEDDYGNYHDEDEDEHDSGLPTIPVLQQHGDGPDEPPPRNVESSSQQQDDRPLPPIQSNNNITSPPPLQQSNNNEEKESSSAQTPATTTSSSSYGGTVWANLMADKDVWSKGITDVAQMVRVSSHRALGHEHLVEEDEEDIEEEEQDANPTTITPASSTATTTTATTSTNDRLFAAPRYATAVFRLWYSLGLCLVTLYWFKDANFWPIYLGGKGHTSNCWDLKGSFAIASSNIDIDFDDANHALKYFFLVQGSYHIHSLCFHLVSMAMLAIYGGGAKGDNNQSTTSTLSKQQYRSTNNKTRMISMKSGFAEYLKSLMQHVIAIVMVCGSYFFSSLRRLGAIGMFAFDVSSIFLHLLQLCINAPKDSVWNNTQRIKWIHRGLVIPTFLYTRFFILPFVVWYSATFESKNWLQQIERTLFPGIVMGAYILFHGLMLLALILNVIYFRRLLVHPHLKKRLE